MARYGGVEVYDDCNDDNLQILIALLIIIS